MAKLRARRREEVFRVTRTRPSTTAGVAEVRDSRALMSDGNLLERSVLRYTPEEVKRNYGKRSHDYGWKVRGRVKAGISLEDLLKPYLDRGWTLESASPSYFTVSGDVVEAHSREPFVGVEAAEKRRASLARQRGKREEGRKAADGPGFYVTNNYLGSVYRPRVADHPKPFANYEAAEEFAVGRYRQFAELQFQYLMPVIVTSAQSRQEAEAGQGEVLWVDGKYRGPAADPRQTSFL